MQRRWNAFPFLIIILLTICKPCLIKSSKDSNKFFNYLQGFHMIAISENTSKYDISDCKEDTYSTSANLYACKPTTFPKEPPSCFF